MRMILILILCSLSLMLLGQGIKTEYLLYGIDGSGPYSIGINEDVVNEVTIFSTRDDSLKIIGVQDIETAVVHSKTFLEVQFRIRGGSGIRLRQNVLLCVSHNKIYKALDILSEVSSSVTEVYNKVADSLKLFDEQEDYHVNVSVEHKQGKNLYESILLENVKVRSKYDPSKNLTHSEPYRLQFDTGGCFFYNAIKKLNKRYQIYTRINNKTVDRFISGEVPCIQLYQNVYLLIDNEWYLDNGDDSLSCL